MMIDCLKIIGIVISIWFLVLTRYADLDAITGYLCDNQDLSEENAAGANRKPHIGWRVNNYIAESFKNILMIKTYSKERYMEENYTERLQDNYETVEKVNFYDSVFSPSFYLFEP